MIGDHYNCECPYCGKINHYIAQNVSVPDGKIKEFIKQCQSCHKNIRYVAQWQIKIESHKTESMVEAV